MIDRLILGILGKPLAWRIGRALYMRSREEYGNEISSNGEAALIHAVAAANRTADVLRFWDVGGNLGDWSAVAIAAAGAAQRCAIDIFEPVPAAADHIEQRFADRPEVHLHRIALADASGTGLFEIVSPTGGTNALVDRDHAGAGTIAVTIDTGDAVRARGKGDDIHLIKIDAEGHDLAILKGLRGTLSAGAAHYVQFEYNHRWIGTGGSLHQVFALIADLPYVLAKVGISGFDILPCWNPEADRFFEKNYVLIRRDKVAAIGARRCVWNASNVLVAAR